MRCYLARESHVTVLMRVPASHNADADLIQSVRDINQTRFPLSRLLAIWNTLAGCERLKRFRDRPTAIKRLWAALEALPLTGSDKATKNARLVAMLQRPAGASLDDLVEATGWQRHSVRGALSGVVHKKMGFTIRTSREGDRLVYRITP
jgi:hypothetical protein